MLLYENVHTKKTYKNPISDLPVGRWSWGGGGSTFRVTLIECCTTSLQKTLN